jgi:hypothetical protein
LCALNSSGGAHQGIRVVDSVDVTVAQDEASHGFAGADTVLGEAAGRKWRSATGWFSYSLRIYDDSPLTLVVLSPAGQGDREWFDILVDGKTVATVDRQAGGQGAAAARFDVLFALTKGKTSVTVKLQARPGFRTARVFDIRSVQEHLE